MRSGSPPALAGGRACLLFALDGGMAPRWDLDVGARISVEVPPQGWSERSVPSRAAVAHAVMHPLHLASGVQIHGDGALTCWGGAAPTCCCKLRIRDWRHGHRRQSVCDSSSRRGSSLRLQGGCLGPAEEQDLEDRPRGTGRVGGSTTTALSQLRPDLGILVGGTNRQSEFVQVDTRDAGMLEEALQGVDLVVHTADPFQRAEEYTVLQTAISTKTPYIDVCDHEQAKVAGVPAITTAGIYSGVSNDFRTQFSLTFPMAITPSDLVKAALIRWPTCRCEPLYPIPETSMRKADKSSDPSVLHSDILLHNNCNQKRSSGSACS
ncbi:hypothetical protein SORBI_3008G098230 [Sorghum bicolor]|uniref:Saccharopine dehydrogenase NADP binding domain-containing protein n=1 Tax=Sorghum bicolor TaxID=4558 RepID=A0A1Z5R5X4_SORBI|nr:hypothetical protein SORBI_3008G098230 [Sorghum bicolor]